jgi:arylsulfatase A-like enzyme
MKHIFIVTLTLTGSLFASPVAQDSARPNIILLNIDNHHKGSLSFYGNRFIETPNIDRLFREGLRFDNYHCAGRCTSSRSALMTGRYHARNGSMGTGSAWGQMVEEITTLGHVFSGNGYQTAHFGKWHMGDTYPLRPEDRGFQESLSIHNGGTLRSVVVKPGYNSSDRVADAYRFRHNGEWKVYDGFRTDTWFTELNRYLSETRDKSKPFFVYLATVTAHGPHFGPKDLRDKYKAKYELPEWTHLREAFEKAMKKKRKNGNGEVSYPYDHAADIAGLDRNIGRLLDTLDHLDLSENTLVIYSSDGAGGGFSTVKGNDLKFSGAGTPLVFRWPKLKHKPAAARQETVANIDLLPTLADVCGFNLSATYLETIDGQSMASLMDWPNARPWETRAYINDHQSANKPDVTNDMMLISPLIKTTVYLPDGEVVSWNDQKLKGKVKPEVVSRAQDAYDRWIERVVEDFPLGAFGKVHSEAPTAFLRAYPILDGPAGEGSLGYFLLDVDEGGSYHLDTNTDDQYGAERTSMGPSAFTLSISQQVKPGHLPVAYDNQLNGYRVLPTTFETFFSTRQQTVELPGAITFRKGRYLIHVKSGKGREPSNLRVTHQP